MVPWVASFLVWTQLAQALEIGAELSSKTAADGTLVWLTIKALGENSKEPLANIKIHTAFHDIPHFDIPGGRRALIPIPYMFQPGPLAIVISGPGVKEQTLEILVRAGKYHSEKLKVDATRVNPPKEVEARIEAESAEAKAIYKSITPELYWEGGPFALPVVSKLSRKKLLTSNFGTRRMFNGEVRSPHLGVDFKAKTGTSIVAPARGKVVLAKELYFSGGTVILDHGLGLFTLYAHLSRVDVKVNQIVNKGEHLAQSGATGRVTGPHLHWSAILDENRINPEGLFGLPAHAN